MPQLHVVFGAVQIGLPLAARLLADGHRVRQVTRSGTAAPGVEPFVADLSDPAQATAAAAGADVVYQVINAPYTKWETMLEPLQRGALEGVRAAGARFVVLDNLYGYGLPDGPMRADTPMAPCSRKGAIREWLHRMLLEAAQDGVHLAVARAADFVGPDIRESLLSGDALRRYARGGRIPVPGDPTLPRAYSYGPDVVAGLACLGADPDATGVWMLPTLTTSTSELLGAISDASGVSGKTLGIPRGLLRVLGWAVPLAREIEEMMYQWEVPYTVDCTPFADHFGVTPTPLSAVAASIAA